MWCGVFVYLFGEFCIVGCVWCVVVVFFVVCWWICVWWVWCVVFVGWLFGIVCGDVGGECCGCMDDLCVCGCWLVDCCGMWGDGVFVWIVDWCGWFDDVDVWCVLGLCDDVVLVCGVWYVVIWYVYWIDVWIYVLLFVVGDVVGVGCDCCLFWWWGW